MHPLLIWIKTRDWCKMISCWVKPNHVLIYLPHNFWSSHDNTFIIKVSIRVFIKWSYTKAPTLGAHTHAHGFWVGMDANMLWVGIGRCWWVWYGYGCKFEGNVELYHTNPPFAPIKICIFSACSPISSKYMFMWCVFLDPQLTMYQPYLGVHLTPFFD